MKTLMPIMALLLVLLSCNQGENTAPSVGSTSSTTSVPTTTTAPLPSSELKLGKKIRPWGTLYFSPMYKSSSAGYPIRDDNGKVIGPKLNLKDYCNMGLQGSGAVDGVFYTYSKSSPKWAAPCKYGSVLYSKAPAGSVGQGVYINGKKQELIPFKSIAVDPNEVPYGTKVFIPAAKGLKMPDGTIHDGIFHAHDTGAAIKNDDLHFDFFTGAIEGGLDVAIKLNPFPFVRSSKEHRFDAFMVIE